MAKSASRIAKSVLAAILGSSALTGPAPGAVTDDQTQASLQKSVDFIFSKLSGDHWALHSNDPPTKDDIIAGQTPLALYALLHVGQSIDDPRLRPDSDQLKPVLKYMYSYKPTGTYDACLVANALSFLKLKNDKPAKLAITRAGDYLLSIPHFRHEGGFGYTVDQAKQKPPPYDNFTSQFGVLGLWAIQENDELHAEITQRDWRLLENHWRTTHRKDGGWAYNSDPKTLTSLTMSLAGLASLYITTGYTNLSTELTMRPDKELDEGIAWLTKNLGPTNDGYALYGLERVGLASGLKFFGTNDWYQMGAQTIIQSQQPDGHYLVYLAGGGNPVISTSFAMLFLARGRNPVLFNKLQYPGNTWGARARDDANLTAYLTKQLETPFKWQIVNLKVPASEWLDAPILLITGSTDPKFTAEDIGKLRQFINDGGMIFSTADGASPAFTAAMKEYAALVVDKRYEFKTLPRDHPLFSGAFFEEVKSPPDILGMDNGVRLIWVHSPLDMGGVWHRNGHADKSFWQIPENLYGYVTGKDGNAKDKVALMQELPIPAHPGKRKLSLARIQYAGNWDPEPGGWMRMQRMAATDFDTDLQVRSLPILQLDAKAIPIAHMTGTASFNLSPADIAALRRYVQSGGTLFIDAAGGSVNFTNSAQVLIQSLGLGSGVETIPDGDSLFAGGAPGTVRIQKVLFSKNYIINHGPRHDPDLLGLKVNHRWGVLFSPADLTAAIAGLQSWGVQGYKPESAKAIVRNILLGAGSPISGASAAAK